MMSHLQTSERGTAGVLHLIKQLVFSEGKDWNQLSARNGRKVERNTPSYCAAVGANLGASHLKLHQPVFESQFDETLPV